MRAVMVAIVLGLAVASASRIAVPDEANFECLAKDDPAPKPAATSCGDNHDKTACLCDGAEEGDCAWCTGDFMPASCVGIKAAEWIPGTVAKCKLPKKDGTDNELVAKKHHKGGDDPAPAPAAASCGDNKEKAACLDDGAAEGDCAWCEGDFMPASCVSTKAAQWIPGTVAKCKMPKKKGDKGELSTDASSGSSSSGGGYIPGGGSSGGGYIPGGGSSGGGFGPGGGDYPGGGGAGGCMALKTRKECLRGTDTEQCSWCEGGFMGARCSTPSSAAWIPDFVQKCEDGRVPGDKHRHHHGKKHGGRLEDFEHHSGEQPEQPEQDDDDNAVAPA